MFLPYNFYQLLDFLLKKGERDIIIEEIFTDQNYNRPNHDIDLFGKLFYLNEVKLDSKLNLDQKIKNSLSKPKNVMKRFLSQKIMALLAQAQGIVQNETQEDL